MSITTLIERAEGGRGSDRELDALVLCAALAPDGSKVEQSQLNGAWCIYEPVSYGKAPFRLWERAGSSQQAAFTTSLDAVVSLIEQKLPGWEWLKHEPGRMWLAMSPIGYRTKVQGSGSSDCRALLAATLRDIQALEDSKARLADATNNPVPLTLSDAGSDAEGRG